LDKTGILSFIAEAEVEHYNRNVTYSHENPTIGILINNYKNRCHVTYVGVPNLQKKIVEKALLLDKFDKENKE